jgi:dipeptidase
MIAFAERNGWYDPAAGDFSWRDAFHPATPQQKRYTATRVWSLFRRVAPSRAFDPAYHRGDAGAEPYPLWIEPDRKLSVVDVFDLMRDHYEGTEFDLTNGLDAGPFGCPIRWRPMVFDVDGAAYTWERPISTQQTGFSMVTQSRSWLPDPIGGVTWYGVDDTDFTCYVPLYCCLNDVPPSFATGNLGRFSWDSAWWVFNFVSNYAVLRYSAMIEDVRRVQDELEGDLIALQPAIEQTAVALYGSDRGLMRRFLTDYCVQHAEQVVSRWRALGESLLTKYNDGYVKDADGRPQEVGYPEEWLRAVVDSQPERYRLPADSVRATEPQDY